VFRPGNQDRLYSRKRFGLAPVNTLDERVSIGASKHLSMEEILKFQIIRVLRGSRNDVVGISPFDYFTYISIVVSHYLCSLFCSGQHGPDNLVVADTPAEVTRQSFFDLFLCGVRVFIEKRLRRHYHTRCTKTTLECRVVYK
jgi:hypothetical protein